MNEGSIALTIMSLLIFFSFLGFLFWGIRSGQFKNVEEAKYNMFKDNKAERGNGLSGDEGNPSHKEGKDAVA